MSCAAKCVAHRDQGEALSLILSAVPAARLRHAMQEHVVTDQAVVELFCSIELRCSPCANDERAHQLIECKANPIPS